MTIYHRILLAFDINSKDSFTLNIRFNFMVPLLSVNFTPHVALIIALAVLKFAIFFFRKHQVSLPYNIANLRQLL